MDNKDCFKIEQGYCNKIKYSTSVCVQGQLGPASGACVEGGFGGGSNLKDWELQSIWDYSIDPPSPNLIP